MVSLWDLSFEVNEKIITTIIYNVVMIYKFYLFLIFVKM